MEAKKKDEITVGSVVRYVKAKNPALERYIGETGMVVSVIRDVEFDIFRDPKSCHRKRLKIQMLCRPESFWCDEDQVQLVTSEKQKVPEPEVAAHKFKVGDYVVFIDGSNVPGALTWLSGMKKYVGKRERILHMGSEGKTCKLEHIPFWLNLEWIKLEESSKLKPSPKRTIVIEITDNGADAKYVCGKDVKKTASIKRHPDDKPDDETAAFLVTEKLFGRNLRGLESAMDEYSRLHSETLGWIHGAKEALDEAEKRINKLI